MSRTTAPRQAKIVLTLLLLSALSWSPALAAPTHDRAIERQRADLRKTNYGSRPFQTTQIFLGRQFMERMLNMPSQQHLMDAGSGGHSELLTGHIVLRLRAGVSPAKTTALGIEKPDPRGLALLQKLNPQHQHLWGKFIEAYERGEIAPVHLMADQYGPFSYTDKPHKIIAAEGHLLAPGGALFTHVTSSPTKTKAMTQIVDRSGRDVTMAWFNAIEGLRVIHDQAVQQGDLKIQQVGLERVGDGPIVAPKLTVEQFSDGHPPARRLLWDAN
ncbi:MAG: hypothetical protein KC503_43805 [Myxococcales bacterium]|nr:hypothetical protein [Myxococcales bacterium]